MEGLLRDEGRKGGVKSWTDVRAMMGSEGRGESQGVEGGSKTGERIMILRDIDIDRKR